MSGTDSSRWWAPTQTGKTLHVAADPHELLSTGYGQSVCRSGGRPVEVLLRIPRPPEPGSGGTARDPAPIPALSDRRAVLEAWQEIASDLRYVNRGMAEAQRAAVLDWLGMWTSFRNGGCLFLQGQVDPPLAEGSTGFGERLKLAAGAGVVGLCGRCSTPTNHLGRLAIGFPSGGQASRTPFVRLRR